MPIVLNEPLSFLQRITEYMEHTYLINKASSLPDSIERMQVRHTAKQTVTTATNFTKKISFIRMYALVSSHTGYIDTMLSGVRQAEVVAIMIVVGLKSFMY